MGRNVLKHWLSWFGVAIPCVFALASPSGAIQWDRPIPWKADFVAGEDAGTLITENAAFKNRIRKAMAEDSVSFFPTPLDAEQTLHSLTRADLFYFSGHTISNLDPPMHAIQVNGGKPKKAGKLTAVDIKKHLVSHATGPRLVILVGCQTMNAEDGVPPAFRLDSAFGIHENTRGRAFLGYETVIVGPMADDTMSKMIEFWTRPGPDGVWPTIEEAVQAVKSPIRIVGDSALRYRGRLGFRKGDSAMLDSRFQDPAEGYESVVDDGLPGKPGDSPAANFNAQWSTYPRLDGQNNLACTIMRWDRAEDAKNAFDKSTASKREMSDERAKMTKDYRVEVRSTFGENTSAYNQSTSLPDGTPMHSIDESVTLYRGRFLIETKRGKDGVVADFTGERLTLLQRAKELIDARWPKGSD